MKTFSWPRHVRANDKVCDPAVGESAEDNFIEVGGLRLECVAFGAAPDERLTLVLLHEGLGSVKLWRDFPQKLQAATGCGVFVFSRSGYGESDACDLPRPLDYMTREATDILPQVLDAVGIQQCVLIGHSDGASIAAINAGSVEDHRVRGLVLMAPHFFTEPFALEAIADAKRAYDSADLKSRLTKYHKHVDVAFRGWNDAWLAAGFKEWNVSDVIDYIRVPVLAIQGEQDQYGSIAQIDEIEKRLPAPMERCLLANCQHAPHLEQAALCLASIKSFIARLLRMENQQSGLHPDPVGTGT